MAVSLSALRPHLSLRNAGSQPNRRHGNAGMPNSPHSTTHSAGPAAGEIQSAGAPVRAGPPPRQHVHRERESVMGKLPKFSLARLVMCGGGYQRLSSQEYLRLGLCLPDSCPDCSEGGAGHYVKNDKMVRLILLSIHSTFCSPADISAMPFT